MVQPYHSGQTSPPACVIFIMMSGSHSFICWTKVGQYATTFPEEWWSAYKCERQITSFYSYFWRDIMLKQFCVWAARVLSRCLCPPVAPHRHGKSIVFMWCHYRSAHEMKHVALRRHGKSVDFMWHHNHYRSACEIMKLCVRISWKKKNQKYICGDW